jgi:hypothetical protein
MSDEIVLRWSFARLEERPASGSARWMRRHKRVYNAKLRVTGTSGAAAFGGRRRLQVFA